MFTIRVALGHNSYVFSLAIARRDITQPGRGDLVEGKLGYLHGCLTEHSQGKCKVLAAGTESGSFA